MEEPLKQGGVAGVIVQQPNYYGIVEDLSGVADTCHAHKSLLIINSIAADLALLKTPGEWGADIAVGEAQSLGLPMAWGGPYLGYMCTTENICARCRVESSVKRSTATGSASSFSPCKPESSISVVRELPQTSAPTKALWHCG